MKQLKMKRSICFLLVIAMLFMGMCYENIQTDSFFANNEISQSASIRSSEHITASQIFFVYEENLRQNSNLFSAMRQMPRRTSARIGRSADINLLFVDNMPQYIQIFVPHTICGITPVIFNNLIISNYIHEADGEKA